MSTSEGGLYLLNMNDVAASDYEMEAYNFDIPSKQSKFKDFNDDVKFDAISDFVYEPCKS